MTVQELIDRLESIDDKDQPVMQSRDPEGNGFGPVDEVTEEEDEDGKLVVVCWMGYPTHTHLRAG